MEPLNLDSAASIFCMKLFYMFQWHRLVLAIICLVTLAVRCWGISWTSRHPDEATIASWVNVHRDHFHIEGRFYAEGFFTMLRPFDAVNSWLSDEAEDANSCFKSPEALKKDIELRMGNDIIIARKFNVFLALVNVIVLYLLVQSISGSPWAGLLGAAWMALTPLHIEHSHYAETDIAAVTMLTLSLWLWLKVLKQDTRWRFMLAATVSGFAIGTKFTLTPLLICAGVVSWQPFAGNPGNSWRACCWRMLAALLLCVAGVVIANPGIADWRWFCSHFQSGLNSVYAEREGLGTTDKWAALVANWKPFVSNWIAMGWAWITLVLIGILASFRKMYRWLWPVTIVFPAFYLFYFIFIAPWVRGQEFMLFFPSFAVWAGMGMVTVVDVCHAGLSIPVVKYLPTCLVVLLALAHVTVAGLRRASMFVWPDLRSQALEWFQIHTAADRAIGFGTYTDPAFRFNHCRMVDVGSVERKPIEDVLTNGVEYIIRNPVSHGRGTVDPATGQRFPKYDKYWEGFTGHFQKLWTWTTMEEPAFFFACMPVEYWGRCRSSPVVSLDIPLFQPAFIDEAGDNGMWLMPKPLGSIKSMAVKTSPRRMIIGGPGGPDRSIYLLLQTFANGATVRLRGMGHSSIVKLLPNSLEVVTLKRPWYFPRLSVYDVIEIYVTQPERTDRISCYAEAFVDQSMVLARLIQKSHPGKVLDLVKSGTVCEFGKSLWPVFVAASMEGEWTLAQKLRADAAELLRRIREAETNKPSDVAICGLSGVCYDDHGRIRLNPVSYMVGFDNENRAGVRGSLVATNSLPVRLGRGDYELSFSATFCKANAENAPGGKVVGLSLASGRGQDVVRPVHVDREIMLPVVFALPEPGCVSMNNLELRWRFRGMLAEVEKEISSALARCELKQSRH